jgi:ParB family transcriptional regulator, chromosome partitioning protein
MTLAKRQILRNRGSLEFFREIRSLKDRGYSAHQIAEKANCCHTYIDSMFLLMKHGDPQLIRDLQLGHIPHTIAIHIARARNPEVQKILAEGYKAGTVKVAQIVAIRQRIDEYERENANRDRRGDAGPLTRHFFKEMNKRKRLVRKAKLARSRIAFIVDALKQLFSEERFVALLRAEGICTMPSWLADRIKGRTGRCSISSVQKP